MRELMLIYVIPSDDGLVTDQNSDKSDEKQVTDPNYFGLSIIHIECEVSIL